MSLTFPSRRGFTLIQLLVIIGALLILAALLVPAVGKVRQAAARTHSQNNLKHLGLAIHAHNDSHRTLPPIAGMVNDQNGSILFHLLPYVDQAQVHKQAKKQSWNVAGTLIPLYIDPQDQSALGSKFQEAVATTNYAGNWLVFRDGKKSLQQIPDGTSNTLVFTTRYQICNNTPNAWAYSDIYTWTPMFGYYSYTNREIFQTSPTQEQCDPHRPQGFAYGINVGLGDGSVRFVGRDISATTWYNAMTPDGGEVLGDDF